MAPEDNPRDEYEVTREEWMQERAEGIARALRDLTMQELNFVTLSAMKWGLAISFNQYIPELLETSFQKEPDASPAS